MQFSRKRPDLFSSSTCPPAFDEIQDFLKPEALKVGGVFFDALFNLNKFIGFEQRDPFAERQRRNDPFETDWDRWVHFVDVWVQGGFALEHWTA